MKNYYFIDPLIPLIPDDKYFIYDDLSDDIKQKFAKYLLGSKPIIILIGGPSSVGKSSLAIELARIFGIRTIICTDTVRYTLESCYNKPNLYSYFSNECWKIISKDFSENALIEGFTCQCNALFDSIYSICEYSIRHKQNTIIEGVHLIPKVIERLRKNELANYIILYLFAPYSSIVNCLLPMRVNSTYRHRPLIGYQERLPHYRIFLDWWMKQIKKNNFNYINNNCEKNKLVANAVDEVLTQMI